MISRLLAAQWLAAIYVGGVSFALNVLIARQVGPAVFGEYSVALAAGAVLAIFLDGGMRNLLMRERTLASAHLNHLSDRLPSLAFGHALVASVIASLFAVVLLPEKSVLAVATVACFLGVVFTQFVSAMLRGGGRFGAEAGWQIGQRSGSALAIALVLALGFHESWQILVAWALGLLLAGLAATRGLWVWPRISLDPVLYKAVLPLLWIDLATAVYFRSDMVVLQLLGVHQDRIGQYGAAYRLIEAVIFATNPVAILLFRKMRRMGERHHAMGREILRAVVWAGLLGVAGAVLISLIAEPVVSIAYGGQYSESTALLRVLAWTLVLLLPNAVLTQAALALNLERPYAWAATASAVCNLALNFVFVGQYGPIASAWATIATEVVLLSVLAFVLFGRLNRDPVDRLAGQ